VGGERPPEAGEGELLGADVIDDMDYRSHIELISHAQFRIEIKDDKSCKKY